MRGGRGGECEKFWEKLLIVFVNVRDVTGRHCVFSRPILCIWNMYHHQQRCVKKYLTKPKHIFAKRPNKKGMHTIAFLILSYLQFQKFFFRYSIHKQFYILSREAVSFYCVGISFVFISDLLQYFLAVFIALKTSGGDCAK